MGQGETASLERGGERAQTPLTQQSEPPFPLLGRGQEPFLKACSQKLWENLQALLLNERERYRTVFGVRVMLPQENLENHRKVRKGLPL